jgi:hypothetical protein
VVETIGDRRTQVMSFINSLSPLQWVLLALVPPAIVALYFLKLRRQPLEVPSTYLWSRTIEDLHVNSLWQRLRQSLLLFLQLLLVALLMLACLRPGWRGAKLVGDRFVFLIDTSASMSATDVAPSRLAAAKQQVLGMIDQMKSSDVAMIISFSDVARVEQPFTNSRPLLRQRVNVIQSTNRTSDLREALRAAAGLANPGRTSEPGNVQDVQVADARPATLYLYTDGGFSAVPEFSLGNLEPKYMPIGTDAPHNVAIAAFTAERNPEKPAQLQAFGRLENSGPEAVTVNVSLHLDGKLLDATQASVPAHGSAGVQFDMEQLERGTLQLQLEHKDHLDLDNTAYTAVNQPRHARVLLVTPGFEPLQFALSTEEVRQLADVAVVEPAQLQTKEQQELAAAGYYDLIIYDRCAPPKAPEANTLFLGKVPPWSGWALGEKQNVPIVIDTDRLHPLMQFVELGNVNFLEGFPVKAPAGGAVLIDTDVGSLLSIAPREGFEDAVLGVELLVSDAKGRADPKTDWHIRRSFPVFAMNAVRYLGGAAKASATPTVKPGLPITLRTETPVPRLRVRSPAGKDTEVQRDAQTTFVFSDTEQLGVYDVFEGPPKTPSQRFSVNLFDGRESDLRPREIIELGHEQVSGKGGLEPARKETWKWIVMASLVLLAFEWHVYNRRVYF